MRRDVAMTGEITLRGRVLPIGGLKEKLLAAQRGGLTTVLIPKDNEKDLADIPDNVKSSLKIIPVAMVDEALSAALVREPMHWLWLKWLIFPQNRGQSFQIRAKIRLTLSRISFNFGVFPKKWLKSAVFANSARTMPIMSVDFSALYNWIIHTNNRGFL